RVGAALPGRGAQADEAAVLVPGLGGRLHEADDRVRPAPAGAQRRTGHPVEDVEDGVLPADQDQGAVPAQAVALLLGRVLEAERDGPAAPLQVRLQAALDLLLRVR